MTKTDIDQIKLGGGKKKNGHKPSCGCHICENMKNKAARGGYTEELEKKEEFMKGGYKKKNGHRNNCSCPICKNMKNMASKKTSKTKTKTRKHKMNNHKSTCKCPICKNIKKKGGDGDAIDANTDAVEETSGKEEVAKDEEYDELESVPTVGGKKRRTKRKTRILSKRTRKHY